MFGAEDASATVITLQKNEERKVELFLQRFLRQDGVFLLRLLTNAANALTTVDLTGELWKNYWKAHPPTSDVTLSGGADQSWAINARRSVSDTADDTTVKRKPVHDEHLEPLSGNG